MKSNPPCTDQGDDCGVLSVTILSHHQGLPQFDAHVSLMKLFLIRHAETVDNVAGNYAGVRDSKLTVHGIEQADRLGHYLAQNHARLTHIFSSPLTRTVKTAEAVIKAQCRLLPIEKHDGDASPPAIAELKIVKVPDLIEQDFGYYEGKPFHARSNAKIPGRESDAERRRHDPSFVDVESRDSMCRRADAFLDRHLLPLLGLEVDATELRVAVVSHGMLLSHLWRRLLLRLPRRSLTIVPEITAARGSLVLEHLGGWSNTGYLELLLEPTLPSAIDRRTVPPDADEPPEVKTTAQTGVIHQDDAVVPSEGDMVAAVPPANATPGSSECREVLSNWKTTIRAIDSKEHLVGLKRQRGGIGRLAHDEGQKKLDSFFTKRQRLHD